MPVVTRILKSKHPFCHLSETQLEKLAESALVTYHSRGEVIFKEGDIDDNSVFLICGNISLHSLDGKLTLIKQYQYESRFSISNLKPRQYTAVAESYDTCMLWVQCKHIADLKLNTASLTEDGIIAEVIQDRRSDSRI